ncbi:MAG: hypothetical protein JNM76_05330 [Betaproteobacteria bacterium]|nr:hypothetical protein [Betaproteobacteria bacterium]
MVSATLSTGFASCVFTLRASAVLVRAIAICLGLSLAMPSWACSVHPPASTLRKVSAQKFLAKADPVWAGPALTGSWFDPARSGEGIIIQYLGNGSVLALWFTYPTTGEPGTQAWLLSEPAFADGNKVTFSRVYQPKGGVFGANFNPEAVTRENWGTLELEVVNCETLVLRYQGPASYGSGLRTMTRIAALDQLSCTGITRTLTASGARAFSGLQARTGAWYVPSRSGEGWIVEELPNNQAIVYWFTFDPDGRQAWVGGLGTRSAGRIDLVDARITRGTRFGESFSAAAVERLPWGRMSFVFSGCGQVDMSYESTLPGWGAGSHRGQRLTEVAGAVCLDGQPAARTRGTWADGPPVPGDAQSELAATVLDGSIYALGGFGDPRGFKRYNPTTGSWQTLPAMPAGRDHLAAFALDGGVFFSGGAANGDGNQAVSAFRYDVASQQWEARPELAMNFGSHAAVLNGRVYIGNLDGTLQEYDPRSRKVRRIDASTDPGAPRDHSQVVAFLGEIWMIGGRIPETTVVAIYDPVAERWRAGPSLLRRRGGFAAAVADGQLVIGGGEVLFNVSPQRLEGSYEVIAPGANAWVEAQRSPVSVHGMGSVGLGGRFYAIGGSTVAASAASNVNRMLSVQFTE